MRTFNFVLLFALCFTLAFLSSCKTGPLIDPLEKDRKALLALAKVSKKDFTPQAQIVFSKALVQEQLELWARALSEDASAEFRYAIDDKTAFVLTPQVEMGEANFGAANEERVVLNAPVKGQIAVRIEGGLPLPIPPLSFSADLEVQFGVGIDENTIPRRVVLLTDDKSFAINNLTLGDLGALLPKTVVAKVRSQIEGLLTRQNESGGFGLLSLDDANLPLRGVRARTITRNANTFGVIDLDFLTLEQSAVTALSIKNTQGQNFVLALPQKTLFELVRTMALKSEPIEGHSFEPAALVLDDKGLTLDLRVWKIDQKPVARTYRVQSEFSLKEGALTLEAKSSEEVGKGAGDFDPVALIMRAKILEALEDTLSQVAINDMSRSVSKTRALSMRLQEVRVDSNKQLLLIGKLLLVNKKAESGHE